MGHYAFNALLWIFYTNHFRFKFLMRYLALTD